MKKKPCLLLPFALVVIFANAEPANAASPNPPQGWPVGIDKQQVQDAAARALVEQIQQKLAAVESFSCALEYTIHRPKGNVVEVDEICFRRPELLFRKNTQTQFPLPALVGRVEYTVLDGKTWWQYEQSGPQDPKPRRQVLQFDLAVVKQAGNLGQIIPAFARVLEPFRYMDASTLRLLKEDEVNWTFSARFDGRFFRMKGDTGVQETRVIVRKSDGAIQAARYLDAAGQVKFSEIFQKVMINPAPPANQFTFVSPAGVEVQEATQLFMQQWRAEMAGK